MTNPQVASILPYQAPAPLTPNFGMRAAKAAWLAPVAAVLLFVIDLSLDNWMRVIVFGASAVCLIVGFASTVAALATMQRYGRTGILRPAVIGLCFNLAAPLLLFLIVLACWMY
jgi:hypothetical protein